MTAAMKSSRFNLLGVGISAICMDDALRQLDLWIAMGQREYVCVCPVHSVMAAFDSAELRRIVNAAGMATPDGMPVVWLARLAGYKHVERVYGPDLMQAAMSSGHRHYFYGGRPGVVEKLAERMSRRFPGLAIAGTYTPAQASVEELCTDEVADTINQSAADIVWVGIGSPKQEFWMARMRPRLLAPVLVGVGAAFDFHAGVVHQAPRFIQRSGLEWLFRLSQDPRRLWRRYLFANTRFLFEVTRQALALRHYDL